MNRLQHFGLLSALCLPLCSGGCGGYYILTVPDQLASAEGQAVPVVRLQRNDFFVLALSSKRQPMRFRVLKPDPSAPQHEWSAGPVRASWTDDLGYAGVELLMSDAPVSSQPGRYVVRVDLQDYEGEELTATVPLFVWSSQKPIVAVDLDALPVEFSTDADRAAEALQQIANTHGVMYLTRRDLRTQDQNRVRLQAGGYPDGPILLWERQRWHIRRGGKLNLPQVVIESRMVSQLSTLAETFPNLRHGVTTNALASKGFADAGLTPVVVGGGLFSGDAGKQVGDWSQLPAAIGR